ncbi:MAG: HD domain-containing phosphohydrolase [Planctomycetota bacterium]
MPHDSILMVAPSVLAQRKILLADDDPASLAAVSAILGSAGAIVTAFDDVDRALATIAQDSFDLVVTDLYLGDVRLGFELADAARRCRPEVPVVMLTGQPSFRGANDAMRSQVREMVVKPAEPDRLVEACGRAIAAALAERRARKLESQNRILSQVAPRMIEAKDPTTSGHADRVVHYADRLALRCGVGERDRESLRLAALLHDVGKIGAPDAILCKEGPLDANERKVIEQHPQIGFDILAGLEDCEDTRNWVYQHHERWDGRGYPNRLAGEDVALPGRILILAEVYDALAEARSYKSAWPMEQIVGFFRDQAGKHFDPDLANLVADGLAAEGRRFFAASGELLF